MSVRRRTGSTTESLGSGMAVPYGLVQVDRADTGDQIVQRRVERWRDVQWAAIFDRAQVPHVEMGRVACPRAWRYRQVMRNTFRIKRALGVGATACAAVVLLTGCGLEDTANQAIDQAADQAKDVVGDLSADAASATVGTAVEQTLAEAGYTITEPPSCSADLSASGARLGLGGKVTCTGETSRGSGYEATFDGLITLQGRCPGSLKVDIVGDPTVSLKRIDVCRIARLLEGG